MVQSNIQKGGLSARPLPGFEKTSYSTRFVNIAHSSQLAQGLAVVNRGLISKSPTKGTKFTKISTIKHHAPLHNYTVEANQQQIQYSKRPKARACVDLPSVLMTFFGLLLMQIMAIVLLHTKDLIYSPIFPFLVILAIKKSIKVRLIGLFPRPELCNSHTNSFARFHPHTQYHTLLHIKTVIQINTFDRNVTK